MLCGGNQDDLPFQSIKSADSLVSSMRTKVFNLKVEREMMIRQVSHTNDLIVDADRKLEMAVKKRASFFESNGT